MKKEYLDFLCCPLCNNELILKAFDESNGKIKTGTLVCRSKKKNHSFKIENFIPRFVRSPKYADSFGLQWNKFAQTQLDNRSLNESELRWDSEIGWNKKDLKNKTVIELLFSGRKNNPRSQFLIWKIYQLSKWYHLCHHAY